MMRGEAYFRSILENCVGRRSCLSLVRQQQIYASETHNWLERFGITCLVKEYVTLDNLFLTPREATS